jgi:hypothetical protein
VKFLPLECIQCLAFPIGPAILCVVCSFFGVLKPIYEVLVHIWISLSSSLLTTRPDLKKTGRLTPYSLTASHNKTFAGNLDLRVLRINLTSYGAGDIQTHNNFAVAFNRELGLDSQWFDEF